MFVADRQATLLPCASITLQCFGDLAQSESSRSRISLVNLPWKFTNEKQLPAEQKTTAPANLGARARIYAQHFPLEEGRSLQDISMHQQEACPSWAHGGGSLKQETFMSTKCTRHQSLLPPHSASQSVSLCKHCN